MINPFGFELDPDKNCFLCGIELTDKNKSKEHVFPKWMLNEFNLRNETLELLNGTFIQYKNITIPCCKNCNNGSLSKMEEIISKGVIGGYSEFIKIPDNIIISWLTKLYMGILIKESKLKFDRSNPTLGNIVEKEILDNKTINFLILRSIYHETNIHQDLVSLFVFNISEKDGFLLNTNYKEPRYMYYSNPAFNTIFLKMNDIGIILLLQDGGLMKEIYFKHEAHQKISARSISYFEFIEIFVRIFNKYTLTDFIPQYTFYGSIEEFGARGIQIDNHFRDGFPALFSETDLDEYYQVLLYFCRTLGIRGFTPSNPRNFTFIKELSE